MQRGIQKLQQPVNSVQFIVDRELRNELKPIVFFDSGGARMSKKELSIDFHPHSGVGILTYIPRSELHHHDTGGHSGVVPEGGIQWMLAGEGLWHSETYRSANHGAPAQEPWDMFIHQLWLQMPPAFEEAPVAYKSLGPAEIPYHNTAGAGGVRVLVGKYEGVAGGIETPLDLTYLDVHLDAGESWRWQSPAGQTRGFVYPRGNSLTCGGKRVPEHTLAILEENDGLLEINTDGPVDFVVVLAAPSDDPIVAARGSMHTNQEALDRSLTRLEKIGAELAVSQASAKGAE